VKILKRHLTVANVLSLTALFVALAGTAYAAGKLGPGQVKSVNIAPQAVSNPKIKTQAVTSGKIKNLGINAADLAGGSVINSKIAKKAVTNAKLGSEAVNAAKLAKKAVTEGKIAPEAVTQAKIGAEAISAAKLSGTFYRQLLKNVTYVTETSVNDSETEKSVTATCPTGREAIAGGARINSPLSVNVVINGSYPEVAGNNARTGWIAGACEASAEAGNWQVVAYAVCAEL
jgi:hypothetical protein